MKGKIRSKNQIPRSLTHTTTPDLVSHHQTARGEKKDDPALPRRRHRAYISRGRGISGVVQGHYKAILKVLVKGIVKKRAC